MKPYLSSNLFNIKIHYCMSTNTKMYMLSLFVVLFSTQFCIATPIHYDKADATAQTEQQINTTANTNITTKRVKHQKKQSWLSKLFKKKPKTEAQKKKRKLKKLKRKLLWTLLKSPFKSNRNKSKNKSDRKAKKLNVWAISSFILSIIGLLTGVAMMALFSAAGVITGLIFYLLLGAITYQFAEWGQKDIYEYPDHYTGLSLTKWAKGIVLAPAIFIIIVFLVFLIDGGF